MANPPFSLNDGLAEALQSLTQAVTHLEHAVDQQALLAEQSTALQVETDALRSLQQTIARQLDSAIERLRTVER